MILKNYKKIPNLRKALILNSENLSFDNSFDKSFISEDYIVLKPKPSKFIKKFLSIIDYYTNWYKKIDCNPIGQRPPVPDKDNSKKEGIIRSILWGINIGEITIVKNKINKTVIYTYESIDGGHRKRYIWQFMNNEFSVDGIYFNKLSKSRKKAFEEYVLTFVIYEPMDVYTRGYIFRTLNLSTHPNHQEMLNSHGDVKIANLIRETVRQIQKSNGQYSTENHPIFETTNSSNYKYLDFNNERLFIEELITHIVFRYTQKPLLGGATDENTEKMYVKLQNSKKEVDTLSKKLKNHLNILYDFSKVKKRLFSCGLSQKEWKLLSYLIFYLTDECKKFKIKNFENFYKSFKDCLNLMIDDGGSFSKKTNINYKKDLIPNLDFDSKNRTIGEAFKQYLNIRDNCNKIKQLIIWFLNEFDIFEHIDILDKNRSFEVKTKQNQLILQKYLCYIDDLPLTYAEAEAAHNKPYSLGGKTDKHNIVMVRKIHNRNMGTMSALEYKKIYNKKINNNNNNDNNLIKNLTVNTSPNMAANGHFTL
jgi:hypothetical protein